ncbi:MAG: MOSC domain-containing protein, partial [Candidatus Caldarchaeum sp.]|nr:MOSC domain-containing protein [Candidatus Caldarchaeum sp.]MDW8435398.1 MOSC N-terminal beta barrel domain-containing protein [Candidatus Caldarchaeum sp.]
MLEGVVVKLFRYPVKSLGGEELVSADVSLDGFVGDRLYAVVDAATGLALSAKREPRLLGVSASLSDGELSITLPDGAVYSGEECGRALST